MPKKTQKGLLVSDVVRSLETQCVMLEKHNALQQSHINKLARNVLDLRKQVERLEHRLGVTQFRGRMWRA